MAEVFRHNEMDLCGLASLALHITRILADPEKWAGAPRALRRFAAAAETREERLAGQIYRRLWRPACPER
jgi:hypothetical protein